LHYNTEKSEVLMKRLFFLLSLFILPLFADSVKIAAAANLSYALPELTKAFKKISPQTKLKFTIGGSGKLAIQIDRGAPYDLFLSANMHYPQKLYLHHKALQKPKVYAMGSLVLFSKKQRNLQKGIKLLVDPSIDSIAVANPKTAPYGKAAKEALINAKIYSIVRSKLIYAESISQTLVYALKAADIGIVAKSAMYAPRLSHFKEGKNYIDIDPKLYKPIKQGVVLLSKEKEAKKFYEFLFSKKARDIFKKYGYRVEE